ncbi:hypothetical protein, partial [Paraburkholderia humisilvae]
RLIITGYPFDRLATLSDSPSIFAPEPFSGQLLYSKSVSRKIRAAAMEKVFDNPTVSTRRSRRTGLSAIARTGA